MRARKRRRFWRSALHAVAAAVLAWSTVPDLTPIELRELLLRAARPIPHGSQPSPMGLEIRDAVAAARAELVRRALAGDPARCRRCRPSRA